MPRVKCFSAGQVILASVVGSPVVGSVLFYLNSKACNTQRKGIITLGCTVIFTICAFLMPLYFEILIASISSTVGIGIGLFQMTSKELYQFEDKKIGIIEYRSWWSTIAGTILGCVVLFGFKWAFFQMMGAIYDSIS